MRIVGWVRDFRISLIESCLAFITKNFMMHSKTNKPPKFSKKSNFPQTAMSSSSWTTTANSPSSISPEKSKSALSKAPDPNGPESSKFPARATTTSSSSARKAQSSNDSKAPLVDTKAKAMPRWSMYNYFLSTPNGPFSLALDTSISAFSHRFSVRKFWFGISWIMSLVWLAIDGSRLRLRCWIGLGVWLCWGPRIIRCSFWTRWLVRWRKWNRCLGRLWIVFSVRMSSCYSRFVVLVLSFWRGILLMMSTSWHQLCFRCRYRMRIMIRLRLLWIRMWICLRFCISIREVKKM